MSEYYLYDPDELYHFGIPGMKWGLRRYQNEDGTLTEEGRIHYGKSAAKNYYNQDMYRREQDKANDLQTYKKLGKKIRKAEEKQSLAEAKLSKEDIRSGRYKVAKGRDIESHVLSGVAGTEGGLVTAGILKAVGATSVANIGGGAVALGSSAINPLLGIGLTAAIGAGTALATRVGTHGHYYAKQAKANAPVGESSKKNKVKYPNADTSKKEVKDALDEVHRQDKLMDDAASKYFKGIKDKDTRDYAEMYIYENVPVDKLRDTKKPEELRKYYKDAVKYAKEMKSYDDSPYKDFVYDEKPELLNM